MGEEMKGKVALDISGFERAALRAKGIAKDFGISTERSLGIHHFKGMVAGALTIGAVEHAIEALMEKSHGIEIVAKRFDLTAEAVQSIQYAADQTGISSEMMFKGLQKLALAQEKARGGDVKAAGALKILGVSMDNVKSKSFEEVFFEIGRAANGTEKEILKDKAANDLFGKAGYQILGAMREGFAGVAAGAKAAGMVIENDVVRRLADAQKKLERFKQRVTVSTGQAIGSVMDFHDRAAAAKKTIFGSEPSDRNLGAPMDPAKTILSWIRFFKVLENPPRERGQWADRDKVDIVKSKKAVDSGSVAASLFEGAHFNGPNLTSNQKIGAYSSQNPFLDRQLAIEAEMLSIQKKIEDHAKKTSKSTDEVVEALKNLEPSI